MSREPVFVLGGGPAGAAAARFLAQRGLETVLVERAVLPRPHVGESISPGAIQILEQLGIGEIESLGLALDLARVRWETDAAVLRRHSSPSLLVQRAEFDHHLVRAAERAGAEIRQGNARHADGHLTIDNQPVTASFVIDARGRSALSTAEKRPLGPPLLAVVGYWECASLEHEVSLKAEPWGWVWSAPLQESRHVAAVFCDRLWPRQSGGASLRDFFLNALSMCSEHSKLIVEPQAYDASAFVARATGGRYWLRAGEAALAVDPISSQGVQLAVQSGLHAAIAAHTILRKPERADLARKFHLERIMESAEFHRQHTAETYASVKTQLHALPFWKARMPEVPKKREEKAVPLSLQSSDFVQLDSRASFEPTGTLDGGWIRESQALIHPRLNRPLSFLGGAPVFELLSPLLRPIQAGCLLQFWEDRMGATRANQIMDWLGRSQLLNCQSSPARGVEKLDSGRS